MFRSRKTSDSLKTECGRIRIIAIRAEFSEAHIIMLTTLEGDVEIQRAFEAGGSRLHAQDDAARGHGQNDTSGPRWKKVYATRNRPTLRSAIANFLTIAER